MNVTIADIQQAQRRCGDDAVVRQTPIETSRTLDGEVNATVHLKMEQLQRTGSFKTRGAYNKLTKLSESSSTCTRVVAASAGNHAQGVALAATEAGFDSTIVMPTNAPQAKIDATKGYGARVILQGKTFRDALAHAQVLTDEDSVFVHAYDDPEIIAGQGTIGLEILSQVTDVETVIVPIGGGGLIAGIATVIDDQSPETRIIGVQAEGAATVPQSLQKGEPHSVESVQTIADGIATGGISPRTYNVIRNCVDEVVTVSDTEIAETVLFLLERTKQMIEGAGATTVAALRSDELAVDGEVVVPVLSGGNLSMTDLQTILTHGLSHRDQLVRLRVHIRDQPGEMSRISAIIAEHGANIFDVSHERAVKDLGIGNAYLQFRIETSGVDQTDRIIESIRERGYDISSWSRCK